MKPWPSVAPNNDRFKQIVSLATWDSETILLRIGHQFGLNEDVVWWVGSLTKKKTSGGQTSQIMMSKIHPNSRMNMNELLNNRFNSLNLKFECHYDSQNRMKVFLRS